MPPLQASPVEHPGAVAQHACPKPPHAVQTPAMQVDDVDVHVDPAQQG
jgi:hypothetical protein